MPSCILPLKRTSTDSGVPDANDTTKAFQNLYPTLCNVGESIRFIHPNSQPPMDRVQRTIYQKDFRILFLESKGEAFQTLFERLMKNRYPGDFVACKP